jgi:metal-responsive CopG/Arc/MetJ family transcriptional regulator
MIIYLTRGMTMAKTRVSVTVDESLLRQCERVGRASNRSELFEQALARWLRDRRRQLLEEETERYYAALTADERAEDAEWAALSARALGERWE